jgi:hypothetical protein
MIILGIILLIIGFVASIQILWTIGIIVLVIGLVLALLGMTALLLTRRTSTSRAPLDSSELTDRRCCNGFAERARWIANPDPRAGSRRITVLRKVIDLPGESA